jgi:hypothetical protein
MLLIIFVTGSYVIFNQVSRIEGLSYEYNPPRFVEEHSIEHRARQSNVPAMSFAPPPP